MLSRNASSPFENVRQNTDPRSVLFLPDKCAIPRPVHVAISEPSFVIRTPCPSAESTICPIDSKYCHCSKDVYQSLV